MKRELKSVARTTSSEALLGMLSLGPMSGYQMRQLMEWSTGNFWQESYGQIYPTLKRLRELGLVALVEEGAATSGPQSKVYSLTKLGRERLERWLRTPSQPQVARNELLLKIFFSGVVPLEVVRGQLKAFRLIHEGHLKKFAATDERLRREQSHDSRMPLWLMTLRYGQAQSRALVSWTEDALGICDAMEAGRAV